MGEIAEVLRGGGAERGAAAVSEGARLARHSNELRALVAERDAIERLRARLESACRGESGEDAAELRAPTADAAAAQRMRRVVQMRSSDGRTWLALLCERERSKWGADAPATARRVATLACVLDAGADPGQRSGGGATPVELCERSAFAAGAALLRAASATRRATLGTTGRARQPGVARGPPPTPP